MSIIEKGKNLLSKLSATTIAEISTDSKIPEEEAIVKILDLLNQAFIQESEISYTDPFEKWQTVPTVKEITVIVKEYIHSAYFRNRMIDASRCLEKITTTIQKSSKNSDNYSVMADICVQDVTRLGDGPRYFDQVSRNWSFVQEKGLHVNESHLRVRQKIKKVAIIK